MCYDVERFESEGGAVQVEPYTDDELSIRLIIARSFGTIAEELETWDPRRMTTAQLERAIKSANAAIDDANGRDPEGVAVMETNLDTWQDEYYRRFGYDYP